MKKYFKNRAIELRQFGLSYSEILKEVKVARSTLSLWLRSVGLSQTQKQRLTQKKYDAILRGATKKKKKREDLEILLKNKASAQVKKINKSNLFLIGVALYWAEGSKKIISRAGQSVVFSNSDPRMIIVYLKWLYQCLNIQLKQITFELYIHESALNQKNKIVQYWVERLNISEEKLSHVYLKKQLNKVDRGGREYNGMIRVRVKKSTNLNRQIVGWIDGVYKNIAGSSNGRTADFESVYSRFDS